MSALGIVRNEADINRAIAALDELGSALNSPERARVMLGRAMLISARERRESRGAHYREDYPGTDESLRKKSVAYVSGNEVHTELRDIPERRAANEDQA